MADVLKRVPVREQDPAVRAHNFDEVCLGYNKEEAMEEASRCLHCKNAKCVQGCPVSINIPDFVAAVKEGEFEKAYQVIGQSSALPAVCGRVCPQENQCEGKCIRGIKGEPVSIGKLERFVADWAKENGIKPETAKVKNGKKVAVIGAGPAGLTCAGDLAKLGYEVGDVEITVGTTYEAVGEGLEAGTIDVGLIPGGTYVLYDDGAEVILTATRDGLSKDSDNAKDWNDGQPTEASDKQAVSYRALFIAGPSDKGQELVKKVNAGEELTWEDLDSANWSIMGTSSPAGYIYPALWLQDHYGKGISDLKSAVQSDSYASAFARLASGQVDVLVTYADARRDYAERWNTEFGREGSIWEETGVIGVTAPIYNDTISVSKNSEIMDADLIAALQQAFINIGNTDAGKEVIKIYSHNGYQVAQASDYDNERAAQKLVQELTAAN